MREESANWGWSVAKIAQRQHGVVSTGQLAAAGFSTSAISRRVTAGQLHRMHQGVYAVGHAGLSRFGHWMAAVLACGRGRAVEPGPVLDFWGATLSHRSAAELWEMLPADAGPVDVTVPGGGGRKKRRGIRVHRSTSLLPRQVTLRRGIPVTTPARTLADLRRVSGSKQRLATPWELRRAARQADVLGLPTEDGTAPDGTRSDLEGDFLRLCGRFHLPAPEVNVRVGPHLVDFLWRDRKLIVETDSFIYHGGRMAFQDDRDRDLDLRARGYQVIRLAEKQVNEEPRRVAEVVIAALRVGADAGQDARRR